MPIVKSGKFTHYINRGVLFLLCVCSVFSSGCYALKGKVGEVQYAFSEKETPGTQYYSLEEDTNPGSHIPSSAVIPEYYYNPFFSESTDTSPALPIKPNDVYPDVTDAPILLPESLSAEYISAVNQLGFRFLKTLPKGYTGSFSPPMINMMLEMMLYSANEPATNTIRNTLGTSMSITELQGNSTLLRNKLSANNINIRLSMILNTTEDQDDVFDPIVANKPVSGYGADVKAYDYSMTHFVVSEVNRWMNAGTEGHIRTTITEPFTISKISLFGSVCIDPLWDSASFRNANYNSEVFSSYSGPRSISMLNTASTARTSLYADGTLLAIPSNHGELYCLFGKAPANMSAADYALKVLAENTPVSLIEEMQETTLQISIPQILEHTAINCTEQLRSLGLSDCMDGGPGNFGIMTVPEHYSGLPTISEAYVGTAVVIDEVSLGSLLQSDIDAREAGETGLLTPESVVIKMDSPYFIAVIHRESGCIASLSIVNDPY